jgi:hypothetical protein
MRSKASLRVIGEFDGDALSQQLGLDPSSYTRKGDKNRLGETLEWDIWRLSSPLDKNLPLEEHLAWLIETLEPHYESLKQITPDARVDVFCSITANEQDGFSLSPRALSIFSDLKIKMEVSLILGSEDS